MEYLIVLLVFVAIFLFGVIAAVGRFVFARWRWRLFGNFLARYVVVFGLLFLAEVGFLALFPSLHAVLSHLTAGIVARLLSLFGTEPSVSGSIITLSNPSLAFEVTPSCLGGILYWIFAALVVAEPQATLRQRFIAITAGLGLLIAFNVLRITTSIYLERETGVHVDSYLFLFSIGFVLLLWFAWARVVKGQRRLTSVEAI